MDLKSMRITYSSDLNLQSICQSHSNPTELFSEFFKQACLCKEIIEPNTMFISTCGENQPSIRPVLLKEVKDNNFIFFTNYESKKSQDMDKNNKVAACFYWEPLQRCVRIEGYSEKLSKSESESYFAQRPRQSQLGAWSSHQSSEITSRDVLFDTYDHYEKEFEGKEIPKPDFWGGWKIIPQKVEFWQGEKSRLHQRVEYYREDNQWKIRILSP